MTSSCADMPFVLNIKSDTDLATRLVAIDWLPAGV